MPKLSCSAVDWWSGEFATVMGGAVRSGSGRFQANRKCFNAPNVLEHSLENGETVECISQFAMLLRMCNRQSP